MDETGAPLSPVEQQLAAALARALVTAIRAEENPARGGGREPGTDRRGMEGRNDEHTRPFAAINLRTEKD